jgi:threonine dehydrogenase-like Zn-dependent dehydrogenase
MKAIRVHGPRDARYEEIPRPEPRDDEVLVRVRAAALCATDVEFYHGDMAYITQGLTRLPLTPGHEWSGEVIEVGKRVQGFAEGDRVAGECTIGCRECHYCIRGEYNQCPHRRETGLLNKNGAFAEYIRFPEYFLHKCNTIDFDTLAFAEPTGVAVYAAKTARVTPADSVAVIGCGPIGLFCIQVARAYGARAVYATDTLPQRLEIAREVGADEVWDPGAQDPVGKIRDLTGGGMVDVVIEASGNPDVTAAMEQMVRPRGRLVYVGLTSGRKAEFTVDTLVLNNLTFYGTLGGPGVWPEAIALLESGTVRAEPLITHRRPLGEFVAAIERMESPDEGAVKILLKPDGE